MPAISRDREASLPLYPDMKDKVALVTGGTSGIGLATAKAFMRQGVKVVIASRREAAAKSVVRDLAVLGDVRWFAVDVADGKSVVRLFDKLMNAHGRLDYALLQSRK